MISQQKQVCRVLKLIQEAGRVCARFRKQKNRNGSGYGFLILAFYDQLFLSSTFTVIFTSLLTTSPPASVALSHFRL